MGACSKDELFTQAVNTMLAKGDDAVAQKTIIRDVSKSLQQGGMAEFIVPDLSALSPGAATQLRNESSGKFLYFCKSGSTPGAEFTIDMGGARPYTKVVPGSRIEGGFDGFLLTNTGVAVGTARFMIGQREDVNYEEWDIADGAGQSAANGAVFSATYNSASLANAPVGTPGATSLGWVSIKGARAVRLFVRSVSAIVSCSVRWWVYDAFNAKWFQSPNVENLATGTLNAVSSDFEVGVRDGLVYAEVFNNTNSGGATAFGCNLQVL